VLYQTVNLALYTKMSVPVHSNCVTAVRTGNWVLCGWSAVGLRSMSAPFVKVKVLQVFSGVLFAAVVWMLNCDNSTQCNVTALHSSQCIRFARQTAFCTGGRKMASSVAWTACCYQICKTEHQLFAQHFCLLINAATFFGLKCWCWILHM